MTRCPRVELISLGILLCITARALPSTLRLEISPPGSSNEFSRGAAIVWDAQRDLGYKIQSTTTLGDASAWKTEDIVLASSNGPVRWMAPESLRTMKYYRLILPQPEIFSVEPAWVDSSDSSALLYIMGQLLPTNGFVMINGHVLTPTIVESNGVWAAVSLNGLPPGEPVVGALTVMDSGSNVVATLPVQSPILYGTEMSLEQLQGPPDEPPAVVKTKTKSNQSNDRTAHVKESLEYMVEDFRFKVDHKRSIGGGGRIDSLDFTTGDAFFKSVGGLGSETELGDYQEGGDNDGVRRAPAAEPRSAGLLRSIYLPSGELRCEETDLVIPCPGIDFAWTRTYRSRTGPTTSLGHGWDFSYNMRLNLQPDGTVQFCSGNGRCDTFYPNGTNGWSRDEFFMTIGDLDKDGIPDVVVCANGTRVNFNPVASDKPVSITDRNNNTMTLAYDGLGRLAAIVDTLGRTNVVAYNVSGLLESVTDFSGRTVRYEYDGNGDLVRCISPAVTGTPNGNDFPGGKTNSYAYSSGFGDDRLNHNLVSCTDAKGQTWLQIVYQPTNNPASIDFDAVAYQLRGVDRTDLWRGSVTPSPTNNFATIQVIVRDAVGNVTEGFYDSRQRCVRQLEYTGRSAPNAPVTPTSNRPKGKLRSSDPDYFETEWQWNNDSLCRAMVVNPRSIARQQYFFTCEREFNPQASPLKKGDLRVARQVACCGGADLDGDGTADITERAWHFEYHPNFGSPAGKNVGIYVSSTSGQSGNANLRTRLNQLEDRLQSFGLLARSAAGNSGVNEPVPHTTLHVSRARVVPGRNGVAIKTKGTGADPNRVAFGHGPRQSTDLSGTFGGRILDGTAVRSSVEDFEGNTGRWFTGEVCDDGNETDDDCDSFVTSITDPRGNVSTFEYDANGNCTRHKRRDGALTTADYNLRGQLTVVTNAPDADGHTRVDTFSYYANGPQAGFLQSIAIDEPGMHLTSSFEYDSRGNLTRLVDPRTNDWLFTWNQLDQLVERQTPDRGFGARTATTYSYDAANNVQDAIEEVRDENDNLRYGHLVAIGHDFADRITSIVEQVSTNHFITNRFEYDGNDDLVAVYSPMAASGAEPDNSVAYQYDERRFPWKQVEGPFSAIQCTTEYSYDEFGQLKTVTSGTEDPTPATYSFDYDGFGRCSGVTDPMGNVTTYACDRDDNLVLCRAYCETNDVPGGAANLRYHEWRWTCDELGRPLMSTGSFFDPATQVPIGDGFSVTRYTYAPNGACSSVADDNGHVTRFAYDTVGRLVSVMDAKSNTVSCAYDPSGNIVNVTQSDRSDVTPTTQQFTVTYSYDALDRCVSRVDNVGNTNRYAYDSLDRVVRTVNPNGNATFYSYDDLGCRTLVVADMDGDGLSDVAADAAHSWAYDDNSRCIFSTDDHTNTTSYTYDSRDRLISTTEADGTVCSLVWSPRSNLILRQDANGTVVSNSFDALDRCTTRQITPGAGVASTTTFERYAYDGLSHLVLASNDVSELDYAYDSMGNCVRADASGMGLATLRTYDGVANCTSVTYPSGLVVGYTYDACDQVSQITRCEGCGNPWLGDLVATYAYEGPGRVGMIARGNGVNTRVFWDGVSGTPNAPDDFGWRQVSGVNHQVAGGGAVIDRRTFLYDRNQNKLRRAQIAPFIQGGPMNTNQFAYDALDRLVSFTRSAGTADDVFKSYALDGNGNRQVAFSNGLAQPYSMDNTPPPGPADFQMNQYTSTPFGSQTFDENGNLNSRSSTAGQSQFQYDYANRLVAVNDLSGGFPSPLATFAYDALGRRISKVVYPISLPPVTTEYIADADCDGDPAPPLEIRVDGVLAARFVLDGTRSHDDGVLRLTGSGQPQYLHCDDLGSALALTDAGGAVIERYDYDDFGAPIFLTSDGVPLETNASPAGNSLLFQSMEWDAEVGLYFGHSQGSTVGLRWDNSPYSEDAERWDSDPYAEDSMRAYDPPSGRYVMRAGVPLRFDAATTFAGNNPWSLKEEGGRHTPLHNKYRPDNGSARLAREVLKTYFEHGDRPTQRARF